VKIYAQITLVQRRESKTGAKRSRKDRPYLYAILRTRPLCSPPQPFTNWVRNGLQKPGV